MAIIGIDLGTTNSIVSVWKDGGSVLIPNSLGEVLTPSAVSLDEDGSILVGEIARQRLVTHPGRSVSGFKPFIGTPRVFRLGEREFTAEELSSFVLRSLADDARAFLGGEITEAVVSVPAYFNDNQRYATKDAGRLAGLRVERLVNEPSAAALAARLRAGGEDRFYLVFDFGGGTLDVSTVDCFDDVVEIISISGDNHLGGNNIDIAIARCFCEENGLYLDGMDPVKRAILLRQAEQCKLALSTGRLAMISMEEGGRQCFMTLTDERLVELCAPLLTRMSTVAARALADAGRSARSIDQIILVGGSCRMPVVQQYISHLFPGRPVLMREPDTVVARGIGAYTGIMQRKGELRDVLLTDVCPFSLGVAVYSESMPKTHIMSPIIERNSTLPCSKTEDFYTVTDNQAHVDIHVYQGESLYCDENLPLGDIRVKTPRAPAGKTKVQVRFTYDINGILEVDVSTGKESRSELIVSPRSKMTEEQLRRRLEELSRLKIHPREKDENRLLLAKAQRLYTQTVGYLREEVARRLLRFESVISSQEEYRLRKERDQFSRYLERVEERLSAWDIDEPDDEDEGEEE